MRRLVRYFYDCRNARLHPPVCSCDRHHGPTGRTGGSPFRGCRIRADPASVTDPQSPAQARAQPQHLSSDHDPLYRFHQWKTDLRVLDATEIKKVPYVPLPHPFIEKLIGTLRRGHLDRTLLWAAVDLDAKTAGFQHSSNGHRTPAGVEAGLPEPGADGSTSRIDFESYRWRRQCRGLYQSGWTDSRRKVKTYGTAARPPALSMC